MQPGAVLALVKAEPLAGWPFGPASTRAARGALEVKRSGRRNGSAGVEQRNDPSREVKEEKRKRRLEAMR
jgi:hypothetical protein